jgi:hypothetical protein
MVRKFDLKQDDLPVTERLADQMDVDAYLDTIRNPFNAVMYAEFPEWAGKSDRRLLSKLHPVPKDDSEAIA